MRSPCFNSFLHPQLQCPVRIGAPVTCTIGRQTHPLLFKSAVMLCCRFCFFPTSAKSITGEKEATLNAYYVAWQVPITTYFGICSEKAVANRYVAVGGDGEGRHDDFLDLGLIYWASAIQSIPEHQMASSQRVLLDHLCCENGSQAANASHRPGLSSRSQQLLAIDDLTWHCGSTAKHWRNGREASRQQLPSVASHQASYTPQPTASSQALGK